MLVMWSLFRVVAKVAFNVLFLTWFISNFCFLQYEAYDKVLKNVANVRHNMTNIKHQKRNQSSVNICNNMLCWRCTMKTVNVDTRHTPIKRRSFSFKELFYTEVKQTRWIFCIDLTTCIYTQKQLLKHTSISLWNKNLYLGNKYYSDFYFFFKTSVV